VGSEYSCIRCGYCAGHLRVMGKAERSVMTILLYGPRRLPAAFIPCSQSVSDPHAPLKGPRYQGLDIR
jgi:hypothetical protein